MKRIAYLTATCMLPGSPDERKDSFEHACEMRALKPACAAVGIDLVETVWDDPTWRPADFDAFVVGTTWDYQGQVAKFLARLEEIERTRPLFNPLKTMRWNLDKRYLFDLAARGVLIVPTCQAERATSASIEAAFDEFGTDRVVVKSQVGACAYRQALITRGEELPPAEELPAADTLIQPYLPSAATGGEYSFIYFDRFFSHCAQKIPRSGDYRVQSVFGGTDHRYEPLPHELAAAQQVVDVVDGPLLYARVDLMHLPDGRLALMELEIVEPYLYPEQGPHMGDTFAAALVRILEQCPGELNR